MERRCSCDEALQLSVDSGSLRVYDIIHHLDKTHINISLDKKDKVVRVRGGWDYTLGKGGTMYCDAVHTIYITHLELDGQEAKMTKTEYTKM